MLPLVNWLERKLAEPAATVSGPRTVSKVFSRFSGREHFAGVTLTVRPAKELSLRFNVEPSEADFRWAIEDTIFCALLSRYRQPVLRLEVTVDAIQEKTSASSYFSFKMATSEAIEEALGGVSTNIVWR
jgi:hypothetical protein